MIIVYRLISPSKKSYIGITSKDFSVRFNNHIGQWRLKRGCKKLYNAFDKYHPNLWNYEILFSAENKEEAQQKEIEYIELFKATDDNYGYNICIGGQFNRLGIKHTKESKEKMSISQKSIKRGQQSKETIAKRINSIKMNILLGKSRKPVSEETKKKMSLSHIGKPALNKGIPHTDEAKRKISASSKGKPKPEEFKNNLLGRKLSEDCKNKIRLGQLRYRQSLKDKQYNGDLRINREQRSCFTKD